MSKRKKNMRPLPDSNTDGEVVQQSAALSLPTSPTAGAEPVSSIPAGALSLNDLFRKAQFELEQWADEDDSIDLILAGDLEGMKHDPALQQILAPLQAWGHDIVAKLWKHFTFTVENRRKYYLALLERRGQEQGPP